MRICGFSIVRQGRKFGYPFEESIRSLLPLVDEMVVGAGDADTLRRLKAMGEPKLNVFESHWDMGQREGGRVLSLETDKALQRCRGDWGIYLQADEVLHEDDLEILQEALRRHRDSPVEGLNFRYLHFYGSYQTVQDQRRKWYRQAVRAIKLGQGIVSHGDAYAFRRQGRSLRRADSGARIFHYGWCRPPGVMLDKQINLDRMYHDEAWVSARHAKALKDRERFYSDLGNLEFFRGSHPAAMNARVAGATWSFDHQVGRQWPAWMRHLYVMFVYPILRTLAKP